MFFAVASATGAAHAQRSAADIESARQLYNEGIKLRSAGDLKGALEKLKAAHALGNTPITGLDLCKTHALLSQPVEAREVCLGVARLPKAAAETSRSQEARDEAARVAEAESPKIATIRIHITGVPQGREPTVIVDGATVPALALNHPRAVDPGRHELHARVGKGAESRSSFDLSPGETKDVTLPVQAPPPDEEPPPVVGVPGGGTTQPAPKRSNPWQTTGFIVAGVGLGGGLIAGAVALSKKNGLECTDKLCGPEQRDALDSAKDWGNAATALVIVGGVGAVIAIIATVSPPKARAATTAYITPDFSPTGVGFHGAF